jgi:putative phosphoesterase
MLNIGIISDTHGLLREEAVELLRGVDHIIHAGDIGSPDIIPKLETIAPVTAIRGNVDLAEWAQRFPETARLELSGRNFFVIHDRMELAVRPAEEGISAVISGHSHRPGIETKDGVLYLNPGSAGRRRFRLPVTLATLAIVDDALLPQVHQIG